ncbi:MAG: hypothetical protein USCAAHI_02349 [Beijerinckiaceae bacterium]|jgi:hypothetical protein|nr:MAG: hypothetical protein USCAAHI_02349 [Beijerinckiaceae bacterium]
MKIIIHRLAGVGFGAALAIMLSVDVEAAPMNTSRAPAEILASDGLVMNVTTSRVRVRRRGHRTPRQMVHRHRAPVHRERTLTHRPQ